MSRWVVAELDDGERHYVKSHGDTFLELFFRASITLEALGVPVGKAVSWRTVRRFGQGRGRVHREQPTEEALMKVLKKGLG